MFENTYHINKSDFKIINSNIQNKKTLTTKTFTIRIYPKYQPNFTYSIFQNR